MELLLVSYTTEWNEALFDKKLAFKKSDIVVLLLPLKWKVIMPKKC